MPFCEKCGALQDLPPSGLTHFGILGLDVSLHLNSEELKERFYELSRRLHPDRFAAVSGAEPLYSLRWTTALNKAYQTLRDPHERSYYLLDLFQLGSKARSAQVPLELAETYFELQDLMDEAHGEERLLSFYADLESQLAAVQKEWIEIADGWGTTSDKKVLAERLASNLARERYLRSMMADLNKKVGRNSDRRH